MTKKLLVAALALMATVLLTANSFGQACSSSAAVSLNAVGSSAQFNTWAYATADFIGAGFHLFTVKGNISNGPPAVPIAGLQDTRTSPATLDSATVWFMWDNNAACHAYAYFNVDSGIGQRIYFATSAAKKPAGLPFLDSSLNGGSGTGGSHNQVGGLPDTDTVLPANVFLAFAGNGTTTAPAPFNAAPTDVRPEDELFATTRALTTIPATNTLAGLGYNNTGCGANSAGTVGCVVYTSFASAKYFNLIKYAISGKDPITGGVVPKFTTLSTGAAPVIVFVSNADTAAGGFGSVSGGKYVFNNINRQTLASVFQGRLGRTTDLLPTLPLASGTGFPIQTVQREVVSGTYATFEFTGVRTLTGSSNPASVGASTAVTSNDDSGQEQGNNPTTDFGSANCPQGTGFPVAGATCGDPLFINTPSGGLRLRAIGTGEEVPAVVNTVKNQSTSSTATKDGLGYAFWSYGNFAPVATGCTGASGAGDTCTTYLGHYLTVDGVDPLFNTPGGALDTTPNPWGAYNLPQCNLNALPCFNVPFTHVSDGTYPLWTILRVVTPTPVPAVVQSIINLAQQEVKNSARFTSDFVPFEDGKGNLTFFVFRSHYKQGTTSPLNGHKTCTSFQPVTPATCLVDAGGDVGGAVLPVQADVDYHTDFGSVGGTTAPEIYGLRQ
jgi:hypothetical protein